YSNITGVLCVFFSTCRSACRRHCFVSSIYRLVPCTDSRISCRLGSRLSKQGIVLSTYRYITSVLCILFRFGRYACSRYSYVPCSFCILLSTYRYIPSRFSSSLGE